jgi:hypothetical protein
MRLNENEDYGNMANWRREDPRLFRPHGVFIRPWTGVPLSVFIQGSDSLSKHPLNGSYSEFRLSPTVEGFEDVDGDRCVKIRIVTRDKSDERTVGKTILYINTTKNYLPHKHLVFNPPDSQRPVSDRRVESFQNYGTGHTMTGEYYTEVKSVALKVNYDKSLFPNVKFADHKPLYIFKNGTLDGKFFPGGESALKNEQ